MDRKGSERIKDALDEAESKNLPVLIKEDYSDGPPPIDVALTVVAPDWPGLIEAISWNIHSLGFNISEIHAFVTENRRGVVYAVVKLEDSEKIEQFKSGIASIKRVLELSALGDPAIRRLVNISINKVRKLRELLEALREVVKNDEEYKEIVGRDGELEKFLVSRTDAYLNDKSPVDLARQIYTNYIFIKELRRTGKHILVAISNEKTGDHVQTCITVAGFEEEITLDDVLEEIRQYTLNYKVKYNKQFVTEDGITVIRVELTLADGRTPFPKEELPLLQAHLKNRLSKKPKFVSPVTPNYVELVIRLVVPGLQREVIQSKIPQFYLIPENISPDFLDFVMVLAIPKGEKKITINELYNALTNISGITVKGHKYFLKDGVEGFVIWLQAIASAFKDDEDIYSSVKKSIKELVGEVRDFDEGMRTVARKNLSEVINILKDHNIDESFVRQYFYRMSDLARVAHKPKDIAREILMAYRLLSKFTEKRRALEKIETDNWVKIGFVLPEEEEDKANKFVRYFTQHEDLNLTWTHLRDYGAALVVIHIELRGSKKSSHKLLANELFEKIKREIGASQPA